ncbi:MAG: DMT family transporter [Thiolinea sp.]
MISAGKRLETTQSANPLDRVSPYVLLVLTTLFWGANFNVAKAGSELIPPLGLSFWRWAVAFLILLPFVLRPMRHRWREFRQHWLLVLVLSAFGVAGFNSLVYLGLQTTSATNGTIMQSINPIFIILLSGLVLGEKTTMRQWLGIIISLLGVLVILSRGDIEMLTGLDFHSGDLYIICSVIVWGTYTVLLRKLPAELKGLPILGYTVLLGALIILPFYVLETLNGRPMPLSTVSVASVFFVALFPSVLSFLFWNHATQKLGANRTGQFAHLVPTFGILIAILVIGERLQGFHLAGIALVVTGLVLANFQRNLKQAKPGAQS